MFGALGLLFVIGCIGVIYYTINRIRNRYRFRRASAQWYSQPTETPILRTPKSRASDYQEILCENIPFLEH